MNEPAARSTAWRPEPWWLMFGAFGGMAVGAVAGIVGSLVALVGSEEMSLASAATLLLLAFVGAGMGLVPGAAAGLAMVLLPGRGLPLPASRVLAALVTFAVGLLVVSGLWLGGEDQPSLGDATPLVVPALLAGAAFSAWMAGPIRNRPTVRRA